MQRPNILMILSDQHSARFCGCYGHSVVKTPNIDALARSGSRFEHAYCASPLCVPSRMAFMTGRRNQSIEVWDNNTVLARSARTLGHRLAEAGYDAVLCGRMHFNGDDKCHGFRAQVALDPDANKTVPDWRNGGAVEGHSLRTLDASVGHGVERDDVAEAAAIEYIEQRRGKEQPWCMIVGFVHPHGPRNAEKTFWDLYPPSSVIVPDGAETEAVDSHPMHERNRALRQMPEDGFSIEEIRRAHAGYFAAVSRMDDKIGRIISALEASGQRENTIIIYTSDHGEMLGYHNLWMKSSMFENSIRVPLIVSYPEHIPRKSCISYNVSLIDLSATICDWVGADTNGMDGRSFVPLLQGRDSVPEWHNQVLVEFYATWTDRPMAALLNGNYKLIYSHNERPQLFDIASDPDEKRDLADLSDYEAILQAMLTDLMDVWPCEELNRRVLDSQKKRLSALKPVGR